MYTVEVIHATLAVLIGLFVLRVIQKLLTQKNGESKIAAGFEFLLGP